MVHEPSEIIQSRSPAKTRLVLTELSANQRYNYNNPPKHKLCAHLAREIV